MNSSCTSKVAIVVKITEFLGFSITIALFMMLIYLGFAFESGSSEAKFFIDKIMGPLSLVLIISWIVSRVLKRDHPYEFFNHSKYELNGAYRFDFVHDSREEHIDLFKKSILKDGFELAGSIGNQFAANMEVYVRNLELKRDIVLLIETEVFTEDLLLEHLALFKKYIVEYSGYPNWDWKKRMRTVVSVSEMSSPLQILLSTNKILGEPEYHIREVFGQVYALVEEEKKIYLKVYPEKRKAERITWLDKYFDHPTDKDMEYVWKDVKWKDIEPEFPQYKDLVMVVHKALNVWRGGYQEVQDEMNGDESP